MRSAWWKLALVLGLFGPTVWGQEVEQVNWGRKKGQANCPPPCVSDGALLTPTAPGTTPQQPGQSPSEQALAESFAQAGEGGTAPGASFMPAFFGDMFGVTGTRFVQNPSGGGFAIKVPLPSKASGWKAVDGESPRPQNRVYYTFNYYNNIDQAPNAATGGQAFQGYRHIIGLEKTFLQGDASIGLRLPFVSVFGLASIDNQQFSDMSIVTKYALINNRDTGGVLSGGLIITVPTGQGAVVDLPDPSTGTVTGPNPFVLYDVILQPWFGFIRSVGERTYFHGFTSIAVPTSSIDVTILTNDLGVGYWLYRNARDRFVQGVIPTFEAHANIPLNHRGMQSVPIGFSDQLNVTGGIYVVLPRSLFGFAAGVPIVGPNPYQYELNAHYALRF